MRNDTETNTYMDAMEWYLAGETPTPRDIEDAGGVAAMAAEDFKSGEVRQSDAEAALVRILGEQLEELLGAHPSTVPAMGPWEMPVGNRLLGVDICYVTDKAYLQWERATFNGVTEYGYRCAEFAEKDASPSLVVPDRDGWEPYPSDILRIRSLLGAC